MEFSIDLDPRDPLALEARDAARGLITARVAMISRSTSEGREAAQRRFNDLLADDVAVVLDLLPDEVPEDVKRRVATALLFRYMTLVMIGQAGMAGGYALGADDGAGGVELDSAESVPKVMAALFQALDDSGWTI